MTDARKVLNEKDLLRQRNGGGKKESSGSKGVENRAVKLVESGPRMRLKMVKVEEGFVRERSCSMNTSVSRKRKRRS